MKVSVRLTYLRVLMIGVVLFGLAKMTGPQLSRAAEAKKTTELINSLVMLRTGIGIYRAGNSDALPCIDSYEEFKNVLIDKNNGAGQYIKSIPINPFNGLNTIRFDGEKAGANTAGWRLDTRTGRLQADNDKGYAQL